MRSTYALPTWMIEQVNKKEESMPVSSSKKSQCPDKQKDKNTEKSDVIKKVSLPVNDLEKEKNSLKKVEEI